MTRTSALLAALALLAGAAVPASGQDGGRLYFSAGLQTLEIDELNGQLEAEGLPTFDDRPVTLGVGLDRQSGSWLLGAEAVMMLAEEETAGGFERSLDGRFALLEAGYVVPLGGGLRVYPLAGVGLSDLDLTTSQEGSVPFGDLLDGPGPGSEITTGGFVLQPGLGVDLMAGGVTVGVRGGWMFSPGEAEWEAADVTVEGGPDVGMEGFFVRASVGFSDR
jgi:hypothetical protein